MKAEHPEHLLDFVRNMPLEPGVYKYFDAEDTVIYVGKAKYLRKRVSSYFYKNQVDRKTRQLVATIRRIEFTIVNNETDALLLERNQIKEHRPKYNILLRDDKSYPYICVTDEPFPRVIATRNPESMKGKLYGPFASVRSMHAVLEMIKKLFTVRTCTFSLTPKNIDSQKFSLCLEYHIKNCKGPCTGLQSAEDYEEDIRQIRHILKGNLGPVKDYFHGKMLIASEKMAFEEAQELKEKWLITDNYRSKSMVANPKIGNREVITLVSDEKKVFFNYLHIENGCIIRTKTDSLTKKLDEPDSRILRHLISEHVIDLNPESRILTNTEPDEELVDFQITVPKIGDLRHLVDLSLKNVFFLKSEAVKRKAEINEHGQRRRLMETLKKDLNLRRTPDHIECFDNSNIHGTNPVASMVCFREGMPAKKDYRRYHIKTVVGPDDFASMYEVVGRRYKRLKEEGLPFPELVVIDGGKGQLSSAVQALKELDLYGIIPVIGIAKRLEEIYWPGDEFPILLSKKSESLRLLQRIRDEAHRFAINFHRDTRSKKSLVSRMDEIEGIGKKTSEKLLKEFKSLKKIREAEEEDIAEVIGPAKAAVLYNYFHTKD